jgi:hypothetical protein
MLKIRAKYSGIFPTVGRATTHRSIETAGAIGSSRYRRAGWRGGDTRYMRPNTPIMCQGGPTAERNKGDHMYATTSGNVPRHREKGVKQRREKDVKQRQYIPHKGRSAKAS